MINYVNNSFDKVLKPCDAQQFHTLTSSEQTEKLILGHRAGDTHAKAKLPALTYMGVLDEPKYKQYLRQCSEQGGKPLGSRRAEFMRPTGLLMLDYDHQDPHKVFNALKDFLVCTSSWNADKLALAHITPSGDGLRLVLKRAKGKTIEQEQHEWHEHIAEFYEGDLKFDGVCKDISRLSFSPMKSEILYYNPTLLFAELPDAADYPDGTIFGGIQTPSNLPKDPLPTSPSMGRGQSPSPTNGVNTPEALPIEGEMPEGQRGSWDDLYRGVPYAEIVRRLEAQLGGAPAHGARNSFIFSMACNLRYICNDDAGWVASILPTYGEDAQKHRATIQSAINRPMSRTMPETLQRALAVSAESTDTAEASAAEPEAMPPALPSVLPEPLRMLTSCTPEALRPAVAMAVFPALGAHIKDTRFVYADKRGYEPTFMNILVAEQSAGKSSVNAPIHLLLEDIKARDIVHLHQEQEWKDRCASISSTQDKPSRPKGLVVQVLPADMTNAAFVQRLADSEGHFLYTQMDEIELLNSLKTNGSSDVVSAVLRLAFDCGEYGQVRVAANAVNALVNVRWNWNASSTVQRVRKYFHRNIADGTLSRLSFATIIEDDDDWGEEMPEYEEFADGLHAELMRYLDRLTTCSGKLHCAEAVAWAKALNRELVSFAREAEERAYARLSRRGILMGFFRAMLLYVMNDMQWTREIEEFASWSVRYDLWCKMRFFRDLLHKDVDGERQALQRGPVGLLSMLPKEFTRDQLRDLRIAQGMSPDPRLMLSNWKQRGLVVAGEAPNTYTRV